MAEEVKIENLDEDPYFQAALARGVTEKWLRALRIQNPPYDAVYKFLIYYPLKYDQSIVEEGVKLGLQPVKIEQTQMERFNNWVSLCMYALSKGKSDPIPELENDIDVIDNASQTLSKLNIPEVNKCWNKAWVSLHHTTFVPESIYRRSQYQVGHMMTNGYMRPFFSFNEYAKFTNEKSAIEFFQYLVDLRERELRAGSEKELQELQQETAIFQQGGQIVFNFDKRLQQMTARPQ